MRTELINNNFLFAFSFDRIIWKNSWNNKKRLKNYLILQKMDN
ncbi:hypothetical protein M2459_003219 [Parabacteroides sp. PF5-5]|nr:hypothetical protein [Parabacteroides sp. PH5-39]MDH6317492.1 hypothetical protein [Parabacteroides sp. PF5-13]MDH6321205.1 hypothetical protein [Parabacteroides sp. PH5-13]MDH6324937.1 hypothetical protein [Parabacteroides sp. PH5-8]MDH6328646.1 hypothetical protein [Parabacteroides sp. PH5-41]MDH6336448.1 hypothetical protein [Parabacteroides sp. PF5-5]MDH6347512.1 hypothetical protein [Parabacteroides sp. PH5-46]MDH6362474.1 hypothetical protein [Parabacteroides sp. PH5-16]MDH6378142.